MVIMRVNVENNSGRYPSVKASIKGRTYTTVRSQGYHSKTVWAPSSTVALVTREERVAPHTTIIMVLCKDFPVPSNTLGESSCGHSYMSGDCVVDIPITVV